MDLNLCNHISLIIYWVNNFEALVRYNSILEHCRTNWNKELIPDGCFSRMCYLEELKFDQDAVFK